MEKKILFVLALFFMLTGFNGENRIVEQNGVNLQERVNEGVAPSFIQKPRIRQLNDGKDLSIEVQVKADPKPEVTWLHDGVVVRENSNCKIFVEEVNKGIYRIVLEIRNVTSMAAGQYRIKIKNEYGESSAVVNVNFDNE